MKHGFVKVAAAVPYVKVADCYYNVSRIAEMIRNADKEGVEIILFPELSVTGYTAGHILGAIPKTYLPNYREFQEKRWFSPSEVLQYKRVAIGDETVPIGRNILFKSGKVGIGIEICEDMWTPYTPGTRLGLYGAHIIFNLSASNENVGKHNYLRSLISGLSSQGLYGYVYASSGYGESSTDLVYTGKAFIAEIGKIVEEMQRFDYSERMIVSDIDVTQIQSERLTNSSFKSAVSHFTQEEITEIPFRLRKPEDSFPVNRPIRRNPFSLKELRTR